MFRRRTRDPAAELQDELAEEEAQLDRLQQQARALNAQGRRDAARRVAQRALVARKHVEDLNRQVLQVERMVSLERGSRVTERAARTRADLAERAARRVDKTTSALLRVEAAEALATTVDDMLEEEEFAEPAVAGVPMGDMDEIDAILQPPA
jgi:hypothetical protein